MTGPQRAALYRFFDARDRLLYIGITEILDTRLASHRRRSPWRSEIARHTVEWHSSRRAASDAEVAAIRTERPIHNDKSVRTGARSPDAAKSHALAKAMQARERLETALRLCEAVGVAVAEMADVSGYTAAQLALIATPANPQK